MITINTRQDVINVAKTFGVASLKHIMENSTMSPEANRAITECMQWAANEVISVDSFNDGNSFWDIEATFNADKVGGFYCTGIDDITVYRTGMGSFTLPLREAMERKELTTEQCSKLIREITERNEAAAVLYP